MAFCLYASLQMDGLVGGKKVQLFPALVLATAMLTQREFGSRLSQYLYTGRGGKLHLIRGNMNPVNQRCRRTGGAVVAKRAHKAMARDRLAAMIFDIYSGHPDLETHLQALSGSEIGEMPGAILGHLRPDGEQLDRRIEYIPYGDVGGRLASPVADGDDIVHLLAAPDCLLQGLLSHLQAGLIEHRGMDAEKRACLQLIAADGKAVLQQGPVGQRFIDQYLKGDALSIARLEILNCPKESLTAIPGRRRISGDECDASVQLIGDIHIIGLAATQIFIGQGVGQDLSHLSRAEIGGLVDGQLHNIHCGLGSPIVIVFAGISLSDALIRADSRLAGPGEVCRYD